MVARLPGSVPSLVSSCLDVSERDTRALTAILRRVQTSSYLAVVSTVPHEFHNVVVCQK